MVYAGQLTNYAEGIFMLNYFYGIEVSQTQHFRITNHYGKLSSSVIEEESLVNLEAIKEEVYVQCDGSMILTRTEQKEAEAKKKEEEKEEEKKEEKVEEKEIENGGWEEIKLCRVYQSSDRLVNGKRSRLECSEYVGHLGSHLEFEKKAERLIDPYEHLGERLVFISDGASWIHKWQTEIYPRATQILDYFHACEHLSEFAKTAIKDEICRTNWLKKSKEELLDSKLEPVILKIKQLIKGKSKKIQQEGKTLINYYSKNKDRMNYKIYLSRNLQIGSGAIEAAHRNVIQKRMKQSGQRWSRKRAQFVLNLRTCFMSGKWNKVVELIRYSGCAA
jgi:hypothetical protein